MKTLLERIGRCDFTSANQAEIRRILVEMEKNIEELKVRRNEMAEIKFKKLTDRAVTPTKAHPEDAGYDLYACMNYDMVFIPPHQTLMVTTDIAVAIPEGYFGGIYPRSGLASKKGLRPANCTGIIDSSYRGNVIVALHNDSDIEQYIQNRERIAQLIVQPYLQFDFTEVDELDDTERGEGGFGSSGEK